MYSIILNLSKFEFIKIITNNEIEFQQIDLCCDGVKVYFINETQLCIGEESANEIFEPLIVCLKKAINKNLELDGSLTKNLGFMWNEYLQQENGFVMISSLDNSGAYWVGLNYEIMSTNNTTKPHVTVWLYNDKEGNIIFEVTPLYKWSTLKDNPEDPDFITYEEFMKNYKPLIHRVIPRDIAITWLEQAMKIYRGFYSTEEDYQRAIKELNW